MVKSYFFKIKLVTKDQKATEKLTRVIDTTSQVAAYAELISKLAITHPEWIITQINLDCIF